MAMYFPGYPYTSQPSPAYACTPSCAPIPQVVPQYIHVKEVVPVPVPQPYEVEVVKEVEVAPVVQQHITLYQPRPEPSLTVCQYPREWYYVEEKKIEAKAEAKVLSKTVKTLVLRVAHGDDDCEQKISSGKTSLHDDDLDLREGRLVGIRFQNVQVKPGQKVTSAILEFQAKLDKDDNCQVDIYGDASGDAAAFNHELNSVSDRPRTHAQVHWSIPHWVPNSQYTSPELVSVIQEIVSSSRWRYGASLALVLHGTSGHRSAWAFDGRPMQAPALHLKVIEEEEHQLGSAPPGSPVGPTHAAPLGVPLHGAGPFGGPPPHGPVHGGGMADVHDGYDAYGHRRGVGPQGDPWNLPHYAHGNQMHPDPPHHSQTAHLIYEDKFRYPRYNLSHECLRPTRLERQVPESARPIMDRSPSPARSAGALRALDAADGVLDGRFFGAPLPGAGPFSPSVSRW